MLYTVKGENAQKDAPSTIEEKDKADIAASFQETALDDIASKAVNAAKEFGCKAIFCGGGVSNNQRLRDLFTEHSAGSIPLFFPPPALTTDNAAMIAGLGFHTFLQQGKGDSFALEPLTRIPLSKPHLNSN